MTETNTSDAILDEVIAWLKENREETRFERDLINNGPLNKVERIRGEKGTYIVKYYPKPLKALFQREKEGLQLLKSVGLKVPNLYWQTEQFIVLEAIPEGLPKAKFWQSLAEQLHTLHTTKGDSFGLGRNNFIGNMPQINQKMKDGHQFFAENRLMSQAKWAFDGKKLNKHDMQGIESICKRLPELIPQQDPVLLHGDLWTGNVLCDTVGDAYFIDPAVYYGWAEADLSMSKLFGGVDEQVYINYQELANIDSSWIQRAPIYNLYHLLNHLNLFGRSYYASAVHTIKQFA